MCQRVRLRLRDPSVHPTQKLSRYIAQGVREAEAFNRIPHRIDAGAAYLDSVCPGWEHRIERVASVNVLDPLQAPLALASGLPYAQAVATLRLSQDDAIGYGFLPFAIPSTQQGERELMHLNHEWKIEIVTRREFDCLPGNDAACLDLPGAEHGRGDRN